MIDRKRVTWPCGMGDAFAFAGGAIWAARQSGSKYLFPTQPENMESVKELFVDHPEIDIVPLNVAIQALILYSQAMPRTDPEEMLIPPEWSQTFTYINPVYTKDSFRQSYEERGIPYKERFNSFPKEASDKVEQIPLPSGDYAFVHEDVKRGMRITRGVYWGSLLLVRPEFNRTMLAYRDLIENAVRIDCIDSAFFHMVEQFEPIGELFLHMYARKYEPFKNDYVTRHKWKMVW